jgi:hypothetical protein
MKILAITIATLATLAMIIPSSTIIAQVPTQLPVLPEANNNHLPVQTVQDDHLIITTVTKSGQAPEGPIIIIPPKPNEGNGTIITPGENVTENNPGNITIIQPGNNVTEIPNGNITRPDNGTIIITEPGRNITETPGNVTVIDPPRPTQLPVLPPATCQCQNQTNQQPAIPPVLITPAPGQNVTTQLPAPVPAENTTTTNQNQTTITNPAGNTTTTETNQTTTSNQTGNNETSNPTPVTTIIPGMLQKTVSMNQSPPVNSWALKFRNA